MSFQPGIYDRRVEIQVSTRTQSSSGAFTYTWAKFKTIQARRIINSGNERVIADRRENSYSVTWEIPFAYGVIPTMRLVYRDEHYNITSVIEIGRKEKLRLETEQIYDS